MSKEPNIEHTAQSSGTMPAVHSSSNSGSTMFGAGQIESQPQQRDAKVEVGREEATEQDVQRPQTDEDWIAKIVSCGHSAASLRPLLEQAPETLHGRIHRRLGELQWEQDVLLAGVVTRIHDAGEDYEALSEIRRKLQALSREARAQDCRPQLKTREMEVTAKVDRIAPAHFAQRIIAVGGDFVRFRPILADIPEKYRRPVGDHLRATRGWLMADRTEAESYLNWAKRKAGLDSPLPAAPEGPRNRMLSALENGLPAITAVESVAAGWVAAKYNVLRDLGAMAVSANLIRPLTTAGFVALATHLAHKDEDNNDQVMWTGVTLVALGLYQSSQRAYELVSAAWADSTACKKYAAQVAGAVLPLAAAGTILGFRGEGARASRNLLGSILGRMLGARARDTVAQLVDDGLPKLRMVRATPRSTHDGKLHGYEPIHPGAAATVDLTAARLKFLFYTAAVVLNYVYLSPLLKSPGQDETIFGHDTTSVAFRERFLAEAGLQLGTVAVEVFDAVNGPLCNAIAVVVNNCLTGRPSSPHEPHDPENGAERDAKDAVAGGVSYGMELRPGIGVMNAVSRNLSGARAAGSELTYFEATSRRIGDNRAVRDYLALILIDTMTALGGRSDWDAQQWLPLKAIMAGLTEFRSYLMGEGQTAERQQARTAQENHDRQLIAASFRQAEIALDVVFGADGIDVIPRRPPVQTPNSPASAQGTFGEESERNSRPIETESKMSSSHTTTGSASSNLSDRFAAASDRASTTPENPGTDASPRSSTT